MALDVKHLNSEKKFNRLPEDIRPSHYEISISPDLNSFTFSGKQDVFVNVVKSTKTVVLNSVDINIKTVFFSDNSSHILQSQNITYDVSEEKVIITFDNEISEGKHGYLHFEFDGIINEKLNGLYRSKYLSDQFVKYAAVTQFAPIDARRCFPCWDEPAIKATFSISLTIAEGYNAISNMPVKSISKHESNLVSISFEKTPIMSTYLVAFIVFDYHFVEKHSNKTIRVYAPKDKIEQCKFSLDIATKSLTFYESYFGISYPLTKLDLVTVADFSFGAMENWGLITYREAILLVDPKNSSALKKQQAALTIAHEVAHQWFGNLVTMEWWTHLWLNEGYASFMEYLCIDNLFPEYDIWSEFLIGTYIKALELDALANTHPIEVPIENPSEINEIFDTISYNKGASVIRMIYNYIGDNDFRKGMHIYLEKHSYGNVKTEDLWSALGQASNKPIDKIMITWTKTAGFPLVSVIEKKSNNSENRIFSFSQERFSRNGSVCQDDSNWNIPITISSGSDSKKVLDLVLLDKKNKDIEIKNISKETWIKVNVETVGFFRVLYHENLLKILIPALQNQSLSAYDRFGLLDDLFATSQAGKTSTVVFLNLLKEFKNESNYIVWYCIVNNLQKVDNILSHLENINGKFKAFGKNILFNIFSKVGWQEAQNETHLDSLLRILVLSQMASFKDESVILEAQRRFQMHITKQASISPDFRSFIYHAVMSAGNLDTFEKMLTLYRETEMHEERNRILSSLGAIKDINILKKVLDFSTSNEVRPQDVPRVLRSVSTNPCGRILAWEYFKNNWKTFVARYQSGILLITIVKEVTQNIMTKETIKDITEFFENNPIVGIERTVQQSIETIKLNIAWLNRDKDLIDNFLNEND
ncbi:puromycin-sensitive aminopeptidase-like [Phymastichus coffea]|uniref:puromycin-sensitive aminopeptidase-like n=1 Tax=Phymastichus coffea TaxID=108790 RepID=UPI00273C7C5F|nr:puromycin-sensitive aminopeptidase-like [Phymastichus coffea]XP_058809157.1 puromycin-sensitive aminopeptidase-like [Phymastichus coffea]